jgi:hypothetical protein
MAELNRYKKGDSGGCLRNNVTSQRWPGKQKIKKHFNTAEAHQQFQMLPQIFVARTYFAGKANAFRGSTTFGGTWYRFALSQCQIARLLTWAPVVGPLCGD